MAAPETIESGTQARIREISDRLIGRLSPCCLQIETDSGVVSSWWGSPTFYGLPEPKIGETIGEAYDFLHSLPMDVPISLPMIETPNGRVVSIEIVPTDDQLTEILLLDASDEMLRQQQLQQKANEVELLQRRQAKLIRELQELNAIVEEKRREAETLVKLKSQFISSLSHEFRTPLTAIIGYAQMIDRGIDDTKRRGEAARTINRAARHLLSMVDNVLDQGRLDFGKLQLDEDVYDPAALFEEVRQLFLPMANDKGIALAFNAPENPPARLHGDPLRLKQIVINLVSNAIKFSDKGTVGVDWTWADGRLTVAVSDQGPGMDDEQQSRLFRPFSRVSGERVAGTGLGLSICKRLIELMDGAITCQSSPGQGSEFRFDIRADAAPDAAPASLENHDDGASQHELDVLLVEDDEDVGALICALLEQHGCRQTWLKDGQSAVDYLATQTPDLVLLDYNLPFLSGDAVADKARQHGYRGTIVGLTAAGVEEARRLQADRYLGKPFDLSEFAQLLRDVAANRSQP